MDNKIILSYEKITIKKENAFQPNEDGEFWVRVGALNAYNNLGVLYIDGIDKNSLKLAVNDSTSTIRRKMAKNQFHGEAGHPLWEPGISDEKFYERNMFVDPKCMSHSFRQIQITETNEIVDKLGIGGNLCYIDALIYPYGPYEEPLRRALMNPKENVSFSIRAITDNFYVKSMPVRRLKDIITWDWVAEGGIEQANQHNLLKYNFAIENYKSDINTGLITLESSRGVELTPKLLETYLNNIEKKGLSLESSYERGIEIAKNLLNETSVYKYYKW